MLTDPDVGKACTKCGQVKPLEEYGRNRTRPGGLNCWCKGCAREYNRAYRAANRERARESNRAYRAANRERVSESNRAYYAANRERRRAQKRAWQATVKYGMSAFLREHLVGLQDSSCAICRSPFDRMATKHIHTDHDHSCCPGRDGSCGKCVRGILCRSCNLILGHYESRGLSGWAEADAYLADPPYPRMLAALEHGEAISVWLPERAA